jgi:hypothetical protein
MHRNPRGEGGGGFINFVLTANRCITTNCNILKYVRKQFSPMLCCVVLSYPAVSRCCISWTVQSFCLSMFFVLSCPALYSPLTLHSCPVSWWRTSEPVLCCMVSNCCTICPVLSFICVWSLGFHLPAVLYKGLHMMDVLKQLSWHLNVFSSSSVLS